jgi:hypothetical protein
MNHTDPLVDGVGRVGRALSRDGLQEFGFALMFLLAAGLALLKLWAPADTRWVALGWIALSQAALFGFRHLTTRVRRRIAPSRGGYVAPPAFRPHHLLVMAIACVPIGLLARQVSTGVVLVLIAVVLGGFEIVRGRFLGVRRLELLGALAIAGAIGLALSPLDFLRSLLIWTLALALVYAIAGGRLLRAYLGAT